MMHTLLAQAASVPDGGAWDIANKIGVGGAFVLIVVCIFLGKAYLAKDKQLREDVALKDKQLKDEVDYSKERDKQTLTVMIELTTLIKGIDKKDTDGTAAIISHIVEFKTMLRDHLAKPSNQTPS